MGKWIFLFCGLMLFHSGCGRSGPPYSPEEALETFKIEPGFRVELFVAEPDVMDPVAMAFDEDGRIFVVENSGYPLNIEEKVGRVKLLEDTDGDGRPDKSTVFADQLTLPTGVMRWKRGILVTDVPDILYFEDTDGDNVADVRRAVLTGFPLTNPQHIANGLVYGLDNWIYLANERPTTAVIFKEKFGERKSDIRFPDRPDIPPKNSRGRNMRFRPQSHQLEVLSGSSQFGQSFDEWGRHFTVNNSNHIRHEVIGARYLDRNPDLPLRGAMESISDHGNAAEVYPITLRPRFERLSDVGQITSACGLTVYLGGLFPDPFSGTVFVAEPVHNLVHRDVLEPSGATFVARRAQEGVEFLASTDAWFRPVNFTIGPDGALYMIDYYRPIIEHPEWMAGEYHGHSPQHTMELFEGKDRGRIYRIIPDTESALPLPKAIRLGQASSGELVKQLGNPNIWWRRTAQRLLVDRKATDAAPELAKLFAESGSAVARLHALWTLEGLGKLETAEIERALKDPEPGVRENAIVLAEFHLSDAPRLKSKLLQMRGDSDSKVRFQLLSTLGFLNSPAARAARDRLLFENVEDRWMQAAALSAGTGEATRLFRKAVAGPGGLLKKETPGRAEFFRQVCSVIGARRNRAEVSRLLRMVGGAQGKSSAWWRAASLEGLAGGLQRIDREERRLGVAEQDLLLRLAEGNVPSLRRAALRLMEVTGLRRGPSLARALERAATTAENSVADDDRRADAIRLLALAGPARWESLLRKLIDPRRPEQVQREAAGALGRIEGEEVGRFLLMRWRAMTAPVRWEAGDALMREPGRVRLLVAALKEGSVQPWTLAIRHRNRLIMYRDEEIRAEAHAVFGSSSGEREAVLKRYEPAATEEGDPALGREIFRKICAKCHQFNGEGEEVGPDLGTVRSKPKQIILTHLIQPNRAITQNYETYVVETESGALLDGVLGPQTSTTITLRHEEGKEDVILRKDIRRMYASELSAMPNDLEKQVTVREMRDLLSYLKAAP